MIRSPFNWAGNKYNYIKTFKPYLRKYKFVIDLFAGSGNIAFNLEGKNIIYNDIIPLLPVVYQYLKLNKLIMSRIKEIIEENNSFSEKENYYEFRSKWNIKWKEILEGESATEDFVFNTILLLKMCSNSMIRFNKKMEFNQGFRGTKGPFFKKSLQNLIESLTKFNNFLYKSKYIFMSKDFQNIMIPNSDVLLILDPPYLIKQGFYAESYSQKTENNLLERLDKNFDKVDFVYFNYLSYTDSKGNTKEHTQLKEFIAKHKSLQILNLRTKATTGQNRTGKTDVEEVVLLNLKK